MTRFSPVKFTQQKKKNKKDSCEVKVLESRYSINKAYKEINKHVH